jgi:tetratricopeptide (TPR) repeat protein
MEESELVDKFLRGELDAAQSENFTEQIQADNELKRRVALRRLVIEGISLAYTEKLKQDLVEFDKSLDSKRRFQFSWKMAAVFVILIISGSIVYLSNQKPNPYDFDIVEPGLPNAMGENNSIELNNAMNTFKVGDYVASGQAFEQLLANNSKNDTLLYFGGLCDFRNKKSELAIQKWNEIEASSTFFAKAEYRLAIAYWTIGDEKKAVELLKKIRKDENNILREESAKALNALD